MSNRNVLQSMLKQKDPILFNYVLQIDVSEYLEGDHYFIEKTCFCHVSLQQARHLICDSGLFIEAVVISPLNRFSAIKELREEARKRSIPFILYSLKFEQYIKDMAIELKTDDYQYGLLSLSLDYLDFMKRLKRFRYARMKSDSKHTPAKISMPRRCLDILGSTLLLLVLSPLLLVIATILKIGSTGSLFKKTAQAGYCYKIFDAYEFQTPLEGGDKYWVVRFGALLQESGLNKLPALFNVLKGDLSLVGDKPLSPDEAAKLTTDKIAIRLLKTPGLTGSLGIGKPRQTVAELQVAP